MISVPLGQRMLVSSQMGRIPGVIHGFGVRGVTLPEYLETLSLSESASFPTDQLHGNRVHLLPAASSDKVFEGDAFITDAPHVVCHVRSADCVPIIIADTRRRAVAAVHAGWRGTACDVAGAAIAEMRRAFGTEPGDCVAAIGPRICGRCYEVGDEVLTAFSKLAIGDVWRTGERSIDLGLANAALLARAGLRVEQIELLPHCTFCDERFTSYRRDRSELERQVNFIVIKE